MRFITDKKRDNTAAIKKEEPSKEESSKEEPEPETTNKVF
jgi:hypothetical protein